jgi:hypothetical protein
MCWKGNAGNSVFVKYEKGCKINKYFILLLNMRQKEDEDKAQTISYHEGTGLWE